MPLVHRNLVQPLLSSLKDSPVVFLQGARQTGKSTLVRSLGTHGYRARYVTLDDAVILGSARNDPVGFLAGISGPLIIDEVQRVPELALAIKAAVDEDRKPGRFLLTGSANALVLPKVSESLAGRIEIHTLWPLAQVEMEGNGLGIVDSLFQAKYQPSAARAENWAKLVSRLVAGGYPEMLTRLTADRQQAWLGSYVTSILQRDVRDISSIRDMTDLPRLLALIASRAASLLDYADVGRGVGIPQTTLKRYMSLLQATFLIQTLPAWYANIGKRIVKSPKVYLSDTGLLTYLLGADAQRLQSDPVLGGGMLENFVAMELLKQIGWSKLQPTLHHFRTHNGDEVDLVMEDRAGRVVGIEVKASASVEASQLKGLRVLADAAGDRFARGVVLYTGAEVVPFGGNLLAMPVSALWA